MHTSSGDGDPRSERNELTSGGMFQAPGGAWTPSPEEVPYLEALWTIADADKTGKLARSAAVPFFRLSGQPMAVLGEVWGVAVAVADSPQTYYLSKPEFLVAMRLISMAQVPLRTMRWTHYCTISTLASTHLPRSLL